METDERTTTTKNRYQVNVRTLCERPRRLREAQGTSRSSLPSHHVLNGF
jgi:hypothetical protein